MTEVVGRLAVRRAGRVALLTCGAPVARLLPPRGGRRALVALRRAVAAGVAPDGTPPPPDALAAGLRRVMRLTRGPGLVVVVSDFREAPLGPGAERPAWARALGALSGRHDVLAVEVRDPREGELPDAGQLVLVDPETGARMEVDTASGELRRAFAAAELARGDALKRELRRVRARHVRAQRRRRLAARAGREPAMSFQAPLFLLGLAVVPLALAALALARRRPARYAVRFPALPTLAAVAPRGPRWRRIVPPALLCLALSGLALALARPETTVAVPIEQASVVLVTDTSGSMNATDVQPSRLDAAKDAADRFLDKVPDRLRVGLVAFSDAPHTVLRPAVEREPVRSAVDGLTAEGGTATGDALDSALRALGTRGEDAPPAAIVLLSDGANQSGRDPAAVAREAARAGVPIYTVALGTPDGQVEAERPDPAGAAGPRVARGGRPGLGRRRVRRRGRRRARRGLPAAGIADRHAQGEARDQRRVRGRGPAAARRVARRLAALARAAALAPVGVVSGAVVRALRRLVACCGLLLAWAPTAAADHTPVPGTVALVGSLQSELGCPGDWQPECAATQLAPVAGSPGVFRATFDVPAGAFEYKVALNGSWDENYGAGGAPGGANLALTAPGGARHLHLRPRHARHRRRRPQGPAGRARRALAPRRHDRVAGARGRGELPPAPRARGRAGDRGRRDRRRRGVR